MYSVLSPKRDTFSVASEASSLVRLLESGLCHVRQARYAEGIAFLTQAREQLSPSQMWLATAIDVFVQSHEMYSRTREALLQASNDFAKADAAQQAQIVAFANLLLSLIEAIEELSQPQTSPEGPYCCDQLVTQLPQRDSKDNGDKQFLLLVHSEVSKCLPALYITCFGRFEVKRLNQTVPLCPSRSGQTIMRYLIAQSDRSATADKLMGVLWPEDEAEVALRKLRIATSALRRSLNDGYDCTVGGGYILCKDSTYYFNRSVQLYVDFDEFLELYQVGLRMPRSAAISYYEKACNLYVGPFLPGDTYADWSFLRREQLRQIYLAMCRTLTEYYLDIEHYNSAMVWATASLKENQCDEIAYRQLMYAYAARGQRSEALRQYQRCRQVLFQELSVQPMPATEQLFQAIMNDCASPGDRPKIDLK